MTNKTETDIKALIHRWWQYIHILEGIQSQFGHFWTKLLVTVSNCKSIHCFSTQLGLISGQSCIKWKLGAVTIDSGSMYPKDVDQAMQQGIKRH